MLSVGDGNETPACPSCCSVLRDHEGPVLTWTVCAGAMSTRGTPRRSPGQAIEDNRWLRLLLGPRPPSPVGSLRPHWAVQGGCGPAQGRGLLPPPQIQGSGQTPAFATNNL